MPMTFVRAFALLALFVAPASARAEAPLRYTVNLNDRADTLFKVSLRLDGLARGSDIFQFAATAPGTYEVMDIGRFVRRFQAFDADGKELTTTHISTNQWRISDPARVREIRYAIAPTWSTTVAEHPIYLMCGTNLSADHTLINGQGVFGMPRGMQSVPISVRLLMPTDWKVGTALQAVDGIYQAADYDQLVDSPILAGRLSVAQLTVTGVPVDIVVYATHDRINAGQLRDAMSGMLLAAGEFLGKLPVDRYTFLWDLEDRDAGAWEHSYGSEYALREVPFTPAVGRSYTDIAAHEFFHVVTPLNLHSEVIEHFNFETPVASRHLWLYEGSTEWAAHKMQLESGLKSAPAYLATLAQKIRDDRQRYDTAWSLQEMSLTSYSDSGQRQYGNIYQRGAIVAGLLDIRLLELSGGEHGLRDLIQTLSKEYGKKRAFRDDSLFAIIAAHTDPSVRDFFDRYVIGAQHLPVKAYYAKLGLTLVEAGNGMPMRFDIEAHPTAEQLKLRTAWLGKHGRLTD